MTSFDTKVLQIIHYGPSLLMRFAMVMFIGAVMGIIAERASATVGKAYYEFQPREKFFTYEAVIPVTPIYAGQKYIDFDSFVQREPGLDFSYLEAIYCDFGNSGGVIDISGKTDRYVRNNQVGSSPDDPIRWRFPVILPDVPGIICYGRAVPMVLLPYGVTKRQVVTIPPFTLQDRTGKSE